MGNKTYFELNSLYLIDNYMPKIHTSFNIAKHFKNLKRAFIVFMLCVPSFLSAQSVLKGDVNTWFLMLNRFTLDPHWSITNEVHERTGSFLKNQGTFILRPSLDYHINESYELSVGYSFLRFSSYEPYVLPISRSEHNIWEQVMIKQNIGKINFHHRFRFEHRFLENINTNPVEIDGFNYFNRFRYRIGLSRNFLALKGEKQLFFSVFDELWINFDQKYRPEDYARNWLNFALGLSFNPSSNVQLMYMNQYDKSGNGYITSPIIQLTFIKNFNLQTQKD
jgi:hypothetical protein